MKVKGHRPVQAIAVFALLKNDVQKNPQPIISKIATVLIYTNMLKAAHKWAQSGACLVLWLLPYWIHKLLLETDKKF